MKLLCEMVQWTHWKTTKRWNMFSK